MRKPHCGLLFTEIVLIFHSEAVSLFIICHVLKYSAIIYNRCLLAPWLDEFVFVGRIVNEDIGNSDMDRI